MNRKIFAPLLIVGVSLMLLGAGTATYFSDTERSSGNYFNVGTLDLKLSHSSSGPWTDGVTETWTLADMQLGDETPTGSVFLKNFGSTPSTTITITCNYSVTEEIPQTEATAMI